MAEGRQAKGNHDNLTCPCGGRWIPMPNWSSRYRCDNCFVIGYRRAAVQGDPILGIRTTEDIVAYKCNVAGCTRGAVRKVRTGRSRAWRCRDHSERRTE